VDKKLAAEKIRTRLKKRIASILECQPHELPHMKIGSLIHFAFLLDGPSQTIGGFETTMRVLLDLLGHEIVWEIEPEFETEAPEKVVIN
jgi:hypothetical protein